MLIKKRILSINISQGTQADFVDELFLRNSKSESAYICFANVHMLVEAHDSTAFSKVVNDADIVAPDGFPVAKSFQFIHGMKQRRIDGSGVMKSVLSRCKDLGKKVFFYGGTQEMLDTAAVYLRKNYHGLQIAGMYAPPFRPLVYGEKQVVINTIESSGADFVFVALGCPKQEAWMHEMKGHIPAVMLGIGGALPMMIGIQQRAPEWVQKIGFEWLYRLVQEPGRLFRRYAVTNSRFVWMLTTELFKRELWRIWPSLRPKTI